MGWFDWIKPKNKEGKMYNNSSFRNDRSERERRPMDKGDANSADNVANQICSIVNLLLDRPNASVSARDDGDKWTMVIEVGEAERGKVIGKEGRTVGAIRQLAMSIGARNRVRTFIEIDGFEQRNRNEQQTRY